MISLVFTLGRGPLEKTKIGGRHELTQLSPIKHVATVKQTFLADGYVLLDENNSTILFGKIGLIDNRVTHLIRTGSTIEISISDYIHIVLTDADIVNKESDVLTSKDFKDLSKIIEYPGVCKWRELPHPLVNDHREAIARDLSKVSHADQNGQLAYYFIYRNGHWSPESVRCNFGEDLATDAAFTLKQDALMIFSPIDCAEKPYPSHAQQFRDYHGEVAWLYNPWSGLPRDPRDIGTDVFGKLIVND